MIYDAHLHVWNAEGPETPWRPGWGKHAHGPRFTVDDALDAMRSAGVARAALVPAAWDLNGNELVLSAAARFPDRFTAFVTPDLREPVGADALHAWRERGAAGMRVMFPPAMRSSWLKDGTADWFWPAAARAGMPVMVWAPGQTLAVGDVARRNPELRVLVDHLNLGMEAFSPVALAEVEPVCGLARLPNVAVKASALPCDECDASALLRMVVGAFGADRVFWGSDIGRLSCTYRDAIAVVADGDWTADARDRSRVLGGGFESWVEQTRGVA